MLTISDITGEAFLREIWGPSEEKLLEIQEKCMQLMLTIT